MVGALLSLLINEWVVRGILLSMIQGKMILLFALEGSVVGSLLLRKSKYLQGAHEGKIERGHLMGVSSLSIKMKWSDQKKKLVRKRKPLLKGTEGSAGA